MVLAIPNKRPGERAHPADRGRPASGAMGTTRSTDEPREVQHQRAHEPGRGRHATAPWKIPRAGWKDILWRTYQQISDDRLLAVAVGVVFYGLLAIFPALTAFVSLYGLFAKASTINDHLSLVGGFLPSGGVDIVQEQVNRLVAKGDAKLSFGFIFGLGLALWSANAGMKAIMDALNVVYDEKEKRGFIKLNLVSLAFTVAAIASVLLAIGAVVVLPLVLGYIGLGSASEMILSIARWPLLLALIIIGLAVKALKKWITASGKKRTDYLFPGRGVEGRQHPMGARQLSRLLKVWVVEAGLDPSDYSVELLRRTKALYILKGTGDLQTVRALLGHARIESTARYLGLKTKADPHRGLSGVRYLTLSIPTGSAACSDPLT